MLQFLRDVFCWRQGIFLLSLSFFQRCFVEITEGGQTGLSSLLSLNKTNYFLLSSDQFCSIQTWATAMGEAGSFVLTFFKVSLSNPFTPSRTPLMVFSVLISSLPGSTTFSTVSVGFSESLLNPVIPEQWRQINIMFHLSVCLTVCTCHNVLMVLLLFDIIRWREDILLLGFGWLQTALSQNFTFQLISNLGKIFSRGGHGWCHWAVVFPLKCTIIVKCW